MNYTDDLAKQDPKKQMLVVNGNSYTYGEFLARVRQAQAELPVEESRRLCPIRETGILEQLVSFFACMGRNRIPLIVPPDCKIPESDALFRTPVPARAVMAVMTSGTTGTPKILFRSYESWADFFPIQNRIFGIDADSRMFAQGSLSFTGNLNLYMAAFAAGAAVIAEDRFLPGTWEDIIRREHANAVYLIPSKLLLLPRICREKNPEVRTIISGSQSLGKADAQALKRIFPQAQITLYYGASELNYITYVKDADMTEARNLIGKPFPGVKVWVQDAEIYVDSPYHVENITVPYTLMDSGRIDADGNLYFLGRTDDIIGVRGRKVSMMKIENALEQLPEIAEAAVVVLPRADGKDAQPEIVTAYVVSSCEWKPEDIRGKLRSVLADFEIPRRIIRVNKLPKNASGKTDKKRLCVSEEPDFDSDADERSMH